MSISKLLQMPLKSVIFYILKPLCRAIYVESDGLAYEALVDHGLRQIRRVRLEERHDRQGY